jgi:hypothetical protein
MYNVKSVKVNHVGYLHIELVLDEKCQEARPEFFDEAEDLVCPKPECP